MNILLDGLPHTVMVGGNEYPINTGFRTSILFELLMQDQGLTDSEKLWEALELYYPDYKPFDYSEAIDAIVWFYTIGNPPEKEEESEEEESEYVDGSEEVIRPEKMVFSYEYDAPYIFAAFWEQYGIDLTEMREEEMHWWKFKALFQALREDTQIMKIIGYRSIKITDKMSREQKDYYRRMKKIYALPLSQEEKEKQNAIVDALQKGLPVSHLL